MTRPSRAKAKTSKFVNVGHDLYKNSESGKYYVIFRKDGKQIWRSLKTKDFQLAKRKKDDTVKQIDKVDASAVGTTLETLIERYQANLGQLADKTIATRKSILANFKKTWGGALTARVSSIKPMDLQAWLGQHRARLKKATYNEYTRFLRQLFEIAVANKIIAESPAANLKELRRETPVRDTPTWEQLREIVRAIREQPLNADSEDSGNLIEFIGLSGMGNAEAWALRIRDVDWEAGLIRVMRKKTSTGFTIPIFPGLRPFLEKIVAEHGKKPDPETRLFKVRDAKKALASACKRLNYPNYSHRSIRRCFITACVEKGLDFKTIASFQGHRDGGVLIAKTYSHLRSEHAQQMAAKLTDLTV